MLKMNSKKGAGAFETVSGIFITLAIIGVVTVVMFLVMSQTEAQIVDVQGIDTSNTSTWTTAYNGSRAMAESMDDVPAWVPLIVVVLLGSVMIGLIMAFNKRR